jgi:hypothetical protein
MNGAPDRDISRNAGSIHHNNGLWVLCNDSTSRPFDVIVRNVANPLPPRTSPDQPAPRWAISPPGLEIRVCGATGRFILGVRVANPWPQAVDSPKPSDPTTEPLRELTDRDRLLLTAKFLALPDPGEAVGNLEAAEYATAAAPQAEPVTAKAVEDCVGRARTKLLALGVPGISGRDNINQLGRQLLAYSLLRQEDRKLLRPP